MPRARATSISAHGENLPSQQQEQQRQEAMIAALQDATCSQQPRPRRPSFMANGVLHPAHMAEPGEEGYRTPTIEDFGVGGMGFFERLSLAEQEEEEEVQGDGQHDPVSFMPERRRASHRSAAAFDEVTERDHSDANSLSPPPARNSSSKSSSDETCKDAVACRRVGDTTAPATAGNADAANITATNPTRRRRHGWRRPFAVSQPREPLFLDWRQRLRHFTWSYFTITMATGGIANVLWHVPFRFNGLYTIGCIFFILNVVLFFGNVVCISLRFYFHPSTLKNSFVHPTESLFAPAAVVSFGTILLNISQYGTGHVGYWLNTAVFVLFWVDVGLAFVASFGIYLLFWTTQTFTIALMTPIWIFPVYPLLIIGPHAAVLSATLSPDRSAQILVGGFTAQGIGLLVSMMIYSAYIYRLMTQKLPLERLRPGMFVSVGPSAFTASGLSNMAANAQRTWGAAGTRFLGGDGALAAAVLRIIGDWTALWFWGLALWFFCIAVGAHHTMLRGKKNIPFAMTWFSFVFPQTALVNATFAVGKAFTLYPVQVLGCVMTVLLIAMWLFVVAMMIRAIYLKHILWPQKGEDKDEGGFKNATVGTDHLEKGDHVRDASAKV